MWLVFDCAVNALSTSFSGFYQIAAFMNLRLRDSVGLGHTPTGKCLALTLCILLFFPTQVLRYFDYVFTGVFTFEMIIKVCHRNVFFLL